MSSKLRVNIDLKVLISFSDKLVNDWSIFLFFSIFIDQEIVDNRFGRGSIDGHVHNDFVSKLAFFFHLNDEGGQNSIVLSLSEVLFDSDGGLS